MSADAALAVLLRRTQWLLDDLAFHAGTGHLDPDDLTRTATALDEISQLLRDKAQVATPIERTD